ncbi:MAG: PLP-dependent aminotransferase family protein [Peptostreptococcaceae bacterium]|nr:PLP-dependent aminotransferase family protein [Peptostreptococcaceae bacterium]
MKYAERMNYLKPSDIREVMKIIASNPGTISFAGGLPDPALFPFEGILKATKEILEENPVLALQYGMTQGKENLRKTIVELMKREGVETDVESISITHGSQQGISLTSMLFLNPGDVVLTENPSYLGAFSAYKPYEINFVGVNGDKDGMFMDDLEDKIKANSNVKMIYIIPNFQNPTGRTWSLERRKALIDVANKYDLPIVEDNAYGELRFDGERIPSIKSLDTQGRVLYLGSFSKVLAPGLRVGWLCSSKEVAPKFEYLKYGADLQNTELSQMIIETFLRENDLDEHLNKIKGVYKRRRDLMIDEIKRSFPEKAKYYYPEGGMFVWVELPSHINTRELLKKAVAKKVAFVPGGSFYPAGDCESSMRLNFSTMEDDKIVEGIKILGELLHEEIK